MMLRHGFDARDARAMRRRSLILSRSFPGSGRQGCRRLHEPTSAAIPPAAEESGDIYVWSPDMHNAMRHGVRMIYKNILEVGHTIFMMTTLTRVSIGSNGARSDEYGETFIRKDDMLLHIADAASHAVAC